MSGAAGRCRERGSDGQRDLVDLVGRVAADRGTVSFDHVEPWALLRGLLDDFSIEQDGTTTTLSMSWALS